MISGKTGLYHARSSCFQSYHNQVSPLMIRFSFMGALRRWKILIFACGLLASVGLSHANPKENIAKLIDHIEKGEIESAAKIADLLKAELPQNAEVDALRERVRKLLAKAAARKESSAEPQPISSPLAELWQQMQSAESQEVQKAACEKIIKMTNADRPEAGADPNFWIMRGVAATVLERREIASEVAKVLRESDLLDKNADAKKLVETIRGLGWLADEAAPAKAPPPVNRAPQVLTVGAPDWKSRNTHRGKTTEFISIQGGPAQSDGFYVPSKGGK